MPARTSRGFSIARASATGGGAVLRQCNRRRLKARGTVVYLHSAPDVIAKRVRGDRRRPLLQVSDVQGRIETLCRQREPLYRDTAHIVVAVDDRVPHLVAEDVVHALAAETSPHA